MLSFVSLWKKERQMRWLSETAGDK